MVDKMADVAVDSGVDRVDTVCVLVVKVKQIGHPLRVVILAPPLCLLIRHNLKARASNV